MSFNHGFFPTIDGIDTLVLAACIISFYGGIEIISVHVKNVPSPERTFPRAFLWATMAIIAIYIFGTYAISIIVPEKDISLTQSVLMGFDRYFHYFKIPWMSVIIAIALAIGVFAEALVWISSPSKGIFAVGKAGFLPPYFQKIKKRGLPKNILLIQGYVFSALSLLFLVMPTVQSFYQIVCQLAVILHLAMYVLLFISTIVLRYKEPNLARPFRIGKRGNAGAWLIGGVGFIGVIVALVLSFFPPQQIVTGNQLTWFLVLIIGSIILGGCPFVIYKLRKVSWEQEDVANLL